DPPRPTRRAPLPALARLALEPLESGAAPRRARRVRAPAAEERPGGPVLRARAQPGARAGASARDLRSASASPADLAKWSRRTSLLTAVSGISRRRSTPHAIRVYASTYAATFFARA